MIKYPWTTDHRRFPLLLSMFLVPFMSHATDHTIDKYFSKNCSIIILHCYSVLVFPHAYFIISFCCMIPHNSGGGRERFRTSDVWNFPNHITGCY